MGGYEIPPQAKVRLLPWLALLAAILMLRDLPAVESLGATSSGSAARAVAFAKRQVGKPYRWGGEGPGSFDCSGLTQAAWRVAGVAIPRTAAAQLAKLPRVTRLRPGDLLIYATSGPSRRHVAIVTGAGRMVEARSRATGVMQSRIRRNYIGAVRPRPPATAAPSRAARVDIPPRYLRLYQQAPKCPGLTWQFLAGVGKVESNHGRVARSKPGGSSSAGALGPMQFMPGTWPTYGRGGNVYDPAAAIPAAARYLCANGMPNPRRAAFAYNHGPAASYQPGDGYTADVLAWADRY